jgi:major vault protein
LSIAPTRCTVVKERYALKLEAIRDFEDAEAGISVNAGDEYLLKGPITYQPKIYERVVQEVVP